jgi:hypothetical protein
MDAFLPLIEALVAFALTMLGLATAVSAVVGAWMRAFRWRAHGLRQSILLLYDRDLAPLLSSLPGNPQDDTQRWGYVVDMTMTLDLEPGVPLSTLRQRRIEEIRESEPATTRQMLRKFRRWRTLRYGIDALSAEQFLVRLERSEAGQALAKQRPTDDWEARKSRLLETFREAGATASEAFTRHARVRTIVASFLLAVGVNVDAFNLLNTYLADPGIRRAIIERETQRLAAGDDATAIPSADTSAPETGRVGTAITDLRSQLQAIEEGLLAAPGESPVLTELGDLVGRVDGTLNQIVDTAGEARAAATVTSNIASALTNSFPIGWNLYPNCSLPDADLRCARLFEVGALSKPELGFRKAVSATAVANPAQFIKWLVGVLLTGIMAGLGAPFWMQAVDRAMKLRERPTPT